MGETNYPKDGHRWEPIIEPGQTLPSTRYYTCVECHISGVKVGQAWPPFRDPKYIGPNYLTCEKAKAMKTADALKKLGLKPGDVEP